MRSNSVAFRRLMSDVRDKVYPGLILEHCWVPGTPLNDVDKKHGCTQSYKGRLFGNKEWCRNRKDHFAVMEASDVFRTYDVLYPFQYVTTLERCAYYSTLAEEGKLPVMLTIQERPYIIGPGLGHVLDISPTGMRNGKAVPNDACVALAWQKIAPPFGHDTELRTRYSDEVLEDVWTYSDEDCSWFTAAIGKTVKQGAPAVVTRGLPLPEVKAEGPKPFVCGARYPNGAIALAFLPRVAGGRGYVECLADVTLDAKLEAGKPLGVFGRFRTLTLKGGIAEGAHIQARQLPYGKACDVTVLCTVGEDGSVTIPMAVFEKPQGDYTPNVVIEVASRSFALENDDKKR